MKKLMTADVVIDIYSELENKGINIWLDGGWGVDALLGEQTRDRADIEIIIEEKNLAECIEFLKNRKYSEIPRDDTCAWNFVMGNDEGHEIDFHVISFISSGDGQYGPPENNCFYPAQSFLGEGTIDGREIRCLSPEYQLESHSGYELKQKDHQDIKHLCLKFKLDHPVFIPS